MAKDISGENIFTGRVSHGADSGGELDGCGCDDGIDNPMSGHDSVAWRPCNDLSWHENTMDDSDDECGGGKTVHHGCILNRMIALCVEPNESSEKVG